MNESGLQRAQGPIFVVGMSRSGTKLLRELLNRHPKIRIAAHESHFIPGMLEYFTRRHPQPNDESRRRFIRHFQRTGFYQNMQNRGYSPREPQLLALADQPTWPDVISAVFRYYTDSSNSEIIWGDKSPSYLYRMDVLQRYFPDARFVHIIRDPRDRALSAHKAWKANLLIASQQWLEGMQSAARFQESKGGNYHAVRYESLVTDSDPTIRRLCRFLEVPYTEEMLSLRQPIERRGDMSNPTRTSRAVYAGNIGNFRTQMTPRQLKRIEEIVFPTAMNLGYFRETRDTGHRPLRLSEWALLSVPHYLGGLELFVKRWGPLNGVRRAWTRYRQ